MEEILLHKINTSGTTAFVFETTMNNPQSYDEVYKSYALFNEQNQPFGFYNFNGNSLFIRNDNNNFIELNEVTTNYITGYTGVLKFPNLLTNSEKKRYENKIKNNAIELDPNAIVHILYEDGLTNDIFINVGIHKTYDALNTLSIYNSSINSYPIIQSNTGVVFGRLEATQKIFDPDSGKNVKIPLRNVPIGIFNNESEDFPLPTSVDDSGNRIQLNLKPIIEKDNYLETSYFNKKSKNFDDIFLQSPSNFTNIPREYKYITKTNDEGEFIIYDVPIGNNVLVFDVDLLQQGLTKEEVALNFFPYTSTEFPNVDQLPHFFFRQIPVDIVPSWGDFQSGYTEVNIAVNLDLRKWSTFFVPPISFDERNMQQLQSDDGITNPLKIYIKDMTKNDEIFSPSSEPSSTSEIVEIQELLKRNIAINNDKEGQDYEWYSEFAQLKKSVDFFTNDFHAFKVPANMYYPFGYNSIESQKGSNKKKGVWFAGYQFKMQYLDNGYFRTSGLERQFINGATTSKDNFHINKYTGYDSSVGNLSSIGSGKDKFPYEKVWSYKYPNLAKIPKPPSLINPNWVRNSGTSPKYLDGDQIGKKKDGISGGFGLQQKNDNQSVFFPNKFSKRVNAGLLYKYESNVSWHETYASGFISGLNQNISKVEGGEKYQRVESGFGYFLKFEGWPYIYSNDEYDFMIQSRAGLGTDKKVVFEDSTFDITLDTNPINNEFAREGGIDIYRIVVPEDLIAPDPNITPTFANFNFGNVFRKKQSKDNLALVRPFPNNQGQSKSCYPIGYRGSSNFFFQSYSFKIINKGTTSVTINGQRINPGEFYDGGVTSSNPGNIKLPGNDTFDITSFSFLTCNYEIVFGNYSDGTGTNSNDFFGQEYKIRTIGLNTQPVSALENGVQYNLKSQYTLNTDRIRLKKNGDCGNELENGGGKLNGIILGGQQFSTFIPGSPLTLSIFEEGNLTTTCTDSFFRENVGGGVFGFIPIEGINSFSYYSLAIERV